MKICVVADLHGRYKLLERILKETPGYYYIFLGDIIHHKPFFRRSQRSNPLKIISILMDLTTNKKGAVISGNNEKALLDKFLFPSETITNSEIKYTIEQIKSLSNPKRLEIAGWLLNLPKSLEIDLYRFAHAYYDDPNEGLYGPGYFWFRKEYENLHKLDPKYTYFFGHYGTPYFRENIKIIDCTALDAVGVYKTDIDEFIVYY